MRIDIQARGFDLTEGLRERTERRLLFALSWASQDVRAASDRLPDINGPRGGNDKHYCIEIRLPGIQVVIEDTEADLYLAIDRAVDRTERTVAHRLKRLREHHHDRLSTDEASGEEPAQDAALTANTH